MSQYTASIQQLYVAYFGRPADAGGLAFWEGVVAAAGGKTAAISASFAASAEYTTAFAGKSPVETVNQVYVNLFGHDADPSGLLFWANALQTKAVTIDNVVTAIAGGAQGTDKVAFDSKVAAATAFTAALDTTSEILGYNTAAIPAAKAFIAGVTDEATLATAVAGVDAAVTTVVASGVPVVAPSVFALDSGVNNLTGGSGADIFNAIEASGATPTWTVGDTINGGAGADTLNIVQTNAISQPLSTTVTNVETIKAVSGAGVTLDTTTWTGATTLNSTSAVLATLTAAATTDITATVSGITGANSGVSINGGKDVNLTVSGSTTDADAGAGTEIVIGGTTAAAGTVTVSSSFGAADGSLQDNMSITGGTTINVTQSLTNAVNTTNTQGAVLVTGSAATTAVTVTQDKAATAGATVVGKVAGAVTINDAKASSTTAAGSITTVTLNNFGASSVDSSALTTVNLSGKGTSLDIGRGNLSATPTANTLTLNVNGLTTTGAITDTEAAGDDGFTTVNIVGNTADSEIASAVFADATTINVSGNAAVVFDSNTFASATAINVTNTAGASFGTAIGANVLFTGGAGADTITLSNLFTKAINMGAGDDFVTYDVQGTGGSVAAGAGTDTISMTAAQANSASADSTFNTKFTGFEVLDVQTGATATSINLAGINGVNQVVTRGVGAGLTLTVDGFTTGGTLTLDGAAGSAASNVAANVTNAVLTANDVFNVKLSNGTAATVEFGKVTLAGIETVNISTVDAGTGSSAAATVDTATLVATAATKVVVAGNNGLNLTNTGNTAITSFDASGVVANGSTDTAANLGVTFASANTTASAVVTIVGGAGNDVLTGNAAKDTITGGAGSDIITGGTGADTLNVGQGHDILVFNTNSDTDASSSDSTTAVLDVVNGFKTVSTAITTGVDLSTMANIISYTGNADLTVLDVVAKVDGAGNGVAQAVTVQGTLTGAGQAAGTNFAISSKGLLTLSGAGASAVDTLAEWIVEANAANATIGKAVAFQFGSDTYVFVQNAGQDLLIDLANTTATGLVLVSASTTAAAGDILIGSTLA